MLGRVNLFNKQVVFGLTIPNTFTKQVGFESIHIAESLWLDTTRTQPTREHKLPPLNVMSYSTKNLSYS